MNKNFKHCTFLGPVKKEVLFPCKQERRGKKKQEILTRVHGEERKIIAWITDMKDCLAARSDYCNRGRMELACSSRVDLHPDRSSLASRNAHKQPLQHMDGAEDEQTIFFSINTANFIILNLLITSAIPSTWSGHFNTCEFYHPLVEKYLLVSVRGCRKKKKWE